jgi:guanidinobutyrase
MSYTRAIVKSSRLPIAASLILALLAGPLHAGDAPEDKISRLSEAEREFITSGAILDYIPRAQLDHELAVRDTQGLQALLADLMALAEQMRYDPARDMGAAPLNLASKRFNRSEPVAAPLRKMQREPGPFSVHRYLHPSSGVPTFGDGRVAIWPEDLVAGQVDVAIIGIPSNMSSGRRDAGIAPDFLRTVNRLGEPDAQSLIRPLEVLNVVDYGNFAVDNLLTERSVEQLTRMVAETAGTGAVPMMVGGDTSMLYPGARGVARTQGNGSFGLLHFSAHADADRSADHTISDTQALFLLLNEGVVRGADTIPVGLRGPSLDEDTLRWLRSKEVRYHTMAEIRQRGFEEVLKRVLREVAKGPDAFFVAVDVSVIDPAELVAAGRVETQGMRLQQVTGMIRQVCASKRIVGFEVTDMAPMLDLSRLSALNTHALLNACLAGMAVRAAGLEPDYINPLVLDHGQ